MFIDYNNNLDSFFNFKNYYFTLKSFLLFSILLIIRFIINRNKNQNLLLKNSSFENKTFNNNIIELHNITNVKVCLCTLGKKENRYILEFINHYKKYGIDKIFLYDNNNINDERFDSILSDYLKTKFVEIINFRGKTAPQFKIYNHCYINNYKNYNWLIFYDIDEYINLKNYSNIKNFLSEIKFNKCKLIYLNCFRHTDNNLLYYDNRTLAERFPYINWNSSMYTVKTIIKGNLEKIRFKTSHWLDRKFKGCNSVGKEVKPTNKLKMNNDINEPYFKLYYIDHYCFKSTEEYINKINKGDGIFGYNNKIKMHKIRLYFSYNKISLEKINYIEKNSGLDLTEYKKKLMDIK